jgi:hypothetical protein
MTLLLFQKYESYRDIRSLSIIYHCRNYEAYNSLNECNGCENIITGLPSRIKDSSKENIEWTLTHREVAQIF